MNTTSSAIAGIALGVVTCLGVGAITEPSYEEPPKVHSQWGYITNQLAQDLAYDEYTAAYRSTKEAYDIYIQEYFERGTFHFDQATFERLHDEYVTELEAYMLATANFREAAAR